MMLFFYHKSIFHTTMIPCLYFLVKEIRSQESQRDPPLPFEMEQLNRINNLVLRYRQPNDLHIITEAMSHKHTPNANHIRQLHNYRLERRQLLLGHLGVQVPGHYPRVPREVVNDRLIPADKIINYWLSKVSPFYPAYAAHSGNAHVRRHKHLLRAVQLGHRLFLAQGHVLGVNRHDIPGLWDHSLGQ